MAKEKKIYISDPYRDGTMVKLTGTKHQLLRLGLTSDDLEGPNETTGNYFVRQPVDSPLIVRAEVQNVNDAKEEMKRLHQMTMKTFVDEPDALMFYTSVSRASIGAKITHATPGARLLPIRWPDLAGIMMRDGWIEIGTMHLTGIGLEEAKQCRQFMEDRIKAKSELTDEFD